MPIPSLLLALVLASPAAGGDPTTYARPQLLMEAADLAHAQTNATPQVLDARTRSKYEAGHIPGSVWVDAESWAKSFAADRNPGVWSGLVGKLGLQPDKRIVVLDDVSCRDAARIWWILRYWNFPDVRLLNGGWSSWQAAKGPVTTEKTAVLSTQPSLKPSAERYASKEDVLSWLKDQQFQVLDARSPAEHCGDKKLARRGGSIPSAVNLDWEELLDRKTQRFKPPQELARLFRERGIQLERPSVTYCQSGGRASVLAFALELMGAGKVRNYYRSWNEWGNADDTPVVKPQGKP